VGVVIVCVAAGTDVRWAGEVNLSISVESLKISDEVGGMVSHTHSTQCCVQLIIVDYPSKHLLDRALFIVSFQHVVRLSVVQLAAVL